MTDHDFQQRTTDVLARLDTKMDILVGTDGTGGWKADAEARLRRLENKRTRFTGFVAAGSATIAGVLHWTFEHFFGSHH